VEAGSVVSFASATRVDGGGLDVYGCHNNRKSGGSHCHRGPLSGEQFSSKSEMLDRLKKLNAEKSDAQTKQPKK